MKTTPKSFRRRLGENWFFMTTPPWERIEMTDYNRRRHIFTYTIGWLWILSGIIVGSLLSQPLLDNAQLRTTIWETPISIAIAVGVGFLVQFIGWILFIPVVTSADFRRRAGMVVANVTVVGYSAFAVVVAVAVAVASVGLGSDVGVIVIGAIVSGSVAISAIGAIGAAVSKLFDSNAFDSDISNRFAYGFGVLFPIILSGLCIYMLFRYFRANYDFTNRTVLYSVFVKAIIYPAIGKVLAVIGFGHFFTGIKTAIKVYEE